MRTGCPEQSGLSAQDYTHAEAGTFSARPLRTRSHVGIWSWYAFPKYCLEPQRPADKANRWSVPCTARDPGDNAQDPPACGRQAPQCAAGRSARTQRLPGIYGWGMPGRSATRRNMAVNPRDTLQDVRLRNAASVSGAEVEPRSPGAPERACLNEWWRARLRSLCCL